MLKRFLAEAVSAGVVAVFAASAGAQTTDGGRFLRQTWSGDTRVRANSPDAATGPYKDRWEALQDGRLTIDSPDAPGEVASAALYLELWGGHPGTADKTFQLNGGLYALPEHGAGEGNCVYSYPLVPLEPRHLRKGENVFHFSCHAGTSFWGHYIIDNAALVVELPRDNGDIAAAGLSGFRAAVAARPSDEAPETLILSLDVAEQAAAGIERVEYCGRYFGYDENGDGAWSDWHGFTKGRKSAANIASASAFPFRAEWDLSMMPDQTRPIEVRAVVAFRRRGDIVYVTDALQGIAPPSREGASVALQRAEDAPRPFWSRAGEEKRAVIYLPADPGGSGTVDPSSIERAELHVCIWDGGKGDTGDPFTLNGHPLPVAGEGEHDLLYRIIPVEPGILRKGANEIRLLSDTEHHGIEICLPGPALIVRYRTAQEKPSPETPR